MSPSGKAVGSGPTIRGFESLHPSHIEQISSGRSFLVSSPPLFEMVGPVWLAFLHDLKSPYLDYYFELLLVSI